MPELKQITNEPAAAATLAALPLHWNGLVGAAAGATPAATNGLVDCAAGEKYQVTKHEKVIRNWGLKQLICKRCSNIKTLLLTLKSTVVFIPIMLHSFFFFFLKKPVQKFPNNLMMVKT